jgi:DNA polymerase-3 subunit alpha
VNESHGNFGVGRDGQIRFGLTAIKGLGEAASAIIVSEREKNGPYKDIFDFVQRVPMSAVKRSGLECLAMSGAFDCFSDQLRREQFQGVNAQGEKFLDTLTKFSNSYQQTKMESEYSLFGSDMVEITTPPIPPAEPWSKIELLNKERDLVGIYLSAHPLDDYAVVLQDICNLHMNAMEDLTPYSGQEVMFGGIVTGLRQGVTRRGAPYGIATIEDYSGSGEVALFGQEWPKWGGYMAVGATLLITGRVQGRQYDESKLELRIGSIELLHDVADKMVESITVNMPIDALDEDFVAEFSNLSKPEEGETGTTSLHFVFTDPEGMRLEMMSTGEKIRVTRPLLKMIG